MRSLKVFAASLLFMSATLLPAQRAGGGAGAGFGGHASAGGGGTAGHGNHVVLRYGHRGHNHGEGFGPGLYYPYYVGYGDYWGDPWAFGDYGSDGPPPNEPAYQPQPASPSIIMMQSPQKAVSAPPPSPKLVEVPLEGPATPSKPQPPALFVLRNGQQIESDRYVLSDKSVTVDVGRQQRTIPLSDINVNETMAANHQRGLDIAIPRDSNSLFISF